MFIYVPEFSKNSNGIWANRKTSTNIEDAMGMHMLIVRYTLEKMTLDEHFELGVNVSPNFTPEKIKRVKSYFQEKYNSKNINYENE